MKRVLRFLLSPFRTKVSLELSDDGYYIVKAYNQYLTSTLTKDKEQAEQSFRNAVQQIKEGNKLKHVIIKEAVIY